MKAPVKIKQGNEKLVSHSGLLLVGMLLELSLLKERLSIIDGVHCVNPDFSHADILFSMIGLICIGKPDYDAVELFRLSPEFFVKALGLSAVPSSPTPPRFLEVFWIFWRSGRANSQDFLEVGPC